MPSFFKRRNQKERSLEQTNTRQKESQNSIAAPLHRSLTMNLDTVRQKTGNSPDIVTRTLTIGMDRQLKAAIVYVDGMVDDQTINDYVIETILKNDQLQDKLVGQEVLDMMAEDVVALGSLKSLSGWDELLLSLMSGETIIMVDGLDQALSVSTKGGETRSIEEPSSQVTVRGPRDGFTESIHTNISLVRRRIKTPDLRLEQLNIGNVTHTDVAIMYMKGIANEKVVEEVRRRLKSIDVGSILESGYIEQLIEDETMTVFPTMDHTERPDKVAGNLLEGRIAIIVDGTPFVLLAPVVFIQFFQATEDYYEHFVIATAIRLLRILTFFISLIGPAAYIAATTFHQEMIPSKLLIAIAAQREMVPFPAFVEAFIMVVAFEILREASIRMPTAIGSAISVVGALVVGQAAVEAGIVSPAMVIVVAITGIANFATPAFGMAISTRLINFMFMLAAATFGFLGIILGLILLTVHLCSLRSFGVPYMTPFAPFIPANNKDTIIRTPWWAFDVRPRLISGKNKDREGGNQKPRPPSNRGMVNVKLEKGDENET